MSEKTIQTNADIKRAQLVSMMAGEARMVESEGVVVTSAEYDRLRQVERAAERLWPAVRFFGLCGAAPEYIAAVAELGRLLGKDGDQSTAEAVFKARQQVIKDVADWIKNSGEVRAKAGRGLQADLGEIVAGMKLG